jgi:protein-tyrosine phosphatase
MAAVLSSFGFTNVCCTPHNIRGNYDIESSRVRSATEAFQAALDRENISLKVSFGMEYYIDEFFIANLEDPLTLGASNMLLFETPVQVDPDILKESIYQMVRRRFVPLLAHPERCPLLALPKKGGFFSRKQHDSLAATLREMGCLFQGNIGSFAGVYGREARQIAMEYLEKGLYAHLGTDGHSAGHLDKMLQKGLKVVEEITGKEGMKMLFQL